MSLKNRILIYFSVSLIIFLAIFAVTVFFGFNLSLKDWNRANEEKITAGISEELKNLYNKGTPDKQEIKTAIAPYLKDNMEITIFDPQGVIIFSHNHERLPGTQISTNRILELFMEHERNMAPPPSDPGMPHMERMMRMPGMRMQNFMQSQNRRENRSIPGKALYKPVFAGRQLKAIVKVKAMELKHYSMANRKFLKSIIITLITGTFAALAIALSSSYFISNKLSRDANALSKGLNRLAGGKRDVVFPDKGSKEILSISESALVLQKELIQDEERRKQWAQDIAHDLRTPITAVKAQIEAIIDGVFKPENSRFNKLLKELKHLENLVEDMNSLSRIESSGTELNTSSVKTTDIADILKERFEILADEKKIKLKLKTEPFFIQCNIHLLIRAFSNLLQNSIKYSESGSVVSIDISKEEENALITVNNPGHIDESEIDKIFDRLYRGETGRSSEGSGLGLTIAAVIVSQHKGKIKAENSGGNVKFSIMLPLSQEQSET
jgi:signal transduction histidine kinase